MSEISNTSRFTGLSEAYQKFRPDYPAEIIAKIVEYWAEVPGLPQTLADIGGGTGKSFRAMQRATSGQNEGWTATIVEPNDDMRHQAKIAVADGRDVHVVKGTAEELPFEDASLGIVLAAQAAHWFDRIQFYAEVNRVLAPGGVMCILYNNRELFDDPLMATFETLVEDTVAAYQRDYRSWDLTSELHALDWATDVTECLHPWAWRLTPQEVAGLMLSRSKMKPFVDHLGIEKAEQAIIALAQEHVEFDGLASVQYVTQAALVRSPR